MEAAALSDPIASDALRSALIFLPADGSITPVDGGFRMLTPSNPGYWWGNSLRFDHAPRDGDFERWTQAFARHVHAAQPGSLHMTFGWDGAERGMVEPFVAAGFTYFETISMAVERGATVIAPHVVPDIHVARVTDGDRDTLLALLVETRIVEQSETDYRDFAVRQIALWRSLEAAAPGCWFCVHDGGRIAGALGVFAEKRRGADGRRIGRFQHVVTHPSSRRRGFARMLVAHASTHAFMHLDVDTLVVLADENDAARRVYAACGYVPRSRHRGLERGSP